MSTSPDERRQYPRHRLSVTGSNPVLVTAGVFPRAALVREVSETGMGLLGAFAPPVGAVLPVWLPGKPGEPSVLVLVTVVHVLPDEGELNRIGVLCHDEASRAALRHFVERFAAER